jgi:NADPH:quinone reductase-like Zn-dependent oxidoreductase
VGTYAVQLAKYYGAEVTGVCSTSNLDLVRSLGADHVFDYTREDFTSTGPIYDLVIDAVGKMKSKQRKKILKKEGSFHSVMENVKAEPDGLLFLKERIEAGDVRVIIDRRYTLDQIVEAHQYVQKGHKKGNVVVLINHEPGE